MSVADAGTVIVVPPGDPEGVREGARALTRAAGGMDGAARRTTSTAQAAAVEWRAPAARVFVARASTTARALRALGEGFADAARALDAYAEVLADAQRRARNAQADLLEAGLEHAHAMRAAAAAGQVSVAGMSEEAAARASRAAETAQRYATAAADHALRVARVQAERQAEQAQEDVDAAARRCAWQLEGVADSLRRVTVADLLDWLGGPDTAFGLLSLFGQGVTAKGLYDARKALLAGDLVALAGRDPSGYARVLQAAALHGDDSLQALNAQIAWQQGIMPKLLGEMGDATLPLHGMPTGQMAAALDLLAKAGVVTSVVSNVWTVVSDDPDNTGLDKGMAVANTAGLVMAGTGSATAMGLIGLSASTGWVPVAGQVVLAVTAAYLAYDWYRDNREMVHDLVGRVGDGIGRAADWTQQELREYADEVRRELDTARDAVVGVAQSGVELARDARDRGEELARDARERGEELLADAEELAGQARERGEELLGEARDRGEALLEDAGDLASGARDRAEGVVSAVNPFD